MAMTEKKQRYAEARIAGVPQREAAIQAGYSAKSASQEASRLEVDPGVIAAMHRLAVVNGIDPADMPVRASGKPVEPPDDGETCILAPADDPLVFLKGVMNDLRADPKLRVDAAKSLASYIHAKPGEKGKKEERREAAEKIVGGKFASGAPPLRLVNNKQ